MFLAVVKMSTKYENNGGARNRHVRWAINCMYEGYAFILKSLYMNTLEGLVSINNG